MDLYYAYPAQPPTTAGEELDDLDRDLYDLSEVRAFLTVGAPQPLQLMSQPTIVSSWPMRVPTSGISYKHERYHSPGTKLFYRTLGFRRINEVHTTINVALERLRSTPFHRRHASVGVLYAPPSCRNSQRSRGVCAVLCVIRNTPG